MSNENIEKELEQVSGGLSVRERIAAINNGGLESQIEIKKSYDPSTAFTSGRSISFNDAKKNVANAKDRRGNSINVTGR